MSDVKQQKISPYALLSRWFFDGSSTTKIPEDVLESKAITPLYLLYYFQASPYILYISKHFNNFGLYQMPKECIYNFMKDCILKTGYKPPFIQKIKPVKSEMVECLRTKYIDLKNEDLHMLVKIIDESPEKDSIYEMFGLYKPKTKKLTKVEQKELQEQNKKIEPAKTATLSDLMGNFS